MFRLNTFFNGHLSPGSRRLDAILTVTCEEAAGSDQGPWGQSNGSRLVVFALDCSGSMFERSHKIEAAKRAARLGVRALPRGTPFAVVAFADRAWTVVSPREANPENCAEAEVTIQRLNNLGGTAMSTALAEVRKCALSMPGATVWLYFLTDGRNEGEVQSVLLQEIERCKGLFQADCRGIGTDWSPDDLRTIAHALMGTADAIPDPAALEADFSQALTHALARSTGGVRLDLWRPATSRLVSLKQMQPEAYDITGLGEVRSDRVTAFNLGAWSPGETRDYVAVFEVEPGDIDDELLVCRPSLVQTKDGAETKIPGENVVATWSHDAERTARISPEVAHYTGQAELAASIKEGLAARGRGDEVEATRLLGRATQIAHESGNEDVTRRLSQVVDVVDAEQGTVRMRRGVDRGAELELDMGSTRTVRRTKA